MPHVQLTPETKAQLMSFGDNAVNLEIRFWIDDPEVGRANIISDNIIDRLG